MLKGLVTNPRCPVTAQSRNPKRRMIRTDDFLVCIYSPKPEEYILAKNQEKTKMKTYAIMNTANSNAVTRFVKAHSEEQALSIAELRYGVSRIVLDAVELKQLW